MQNHEQQSMRLHLISIDELKKGLSGYVPEQADVFHEESARLADKLLDQELKESKGEERAIVFLCGGSASGKTEFLSIFYPEAEQFSGLIFDSTFSTIHGATIKIRKVVKNKNIPVVCFIFPDDLRPAFNAFHNRDRVIPDHRFFETHSGSREVALWLAKEHPEIELLLYRNKIDLHSKRNPLSFEIVTFDNQADKVAFLESMQYSSEEIKSEVITYES